MNAPSSIQLSFVGGPFDGFTQSVAAGRSELPEAVALPLNHDADLIFGVGGTVSPRVALYRRHETEQSIEYRFRGLRQPRRMPQPVESQDRLCRRT